MDRVITVFIEGAVVVADTCNQQFILCLQNFLHQISQNVVSFQFA